MGGTIEGDRSAHRARGAAVQPGDNRADPILHTFHSSRRIIRCSPGECRSGAEDEIEGVIAGQARSPGGGLIAMPNSFNVVNRELITALAARYGVPVIYYNRFFPESGGLISYGEDRTELFRLAAGYIDRILKGAKPADLPIQLPTKFELVINLKTAKALGLTVPPLMLGRADDVIE